MNQRSVTLLIAFATLVGAPIMASAAPSPVPTASDDMRAMNGTPVAGTTTIIASMTTYQAVAYGERASKLIGATVYNDSKQAIGKVTDLIINPKDAVSVVVVAVGGFLGLGAKDVALSARYFHFHQKSVILPGATKEMLEKLPPFHYTK